MSFRSRQSSSFFANSPNILLYLILILGCAFQSISPAQDKAGVPEGFKVNVFARPPEVTYPVSVAASPEGAVFVSVDLNSSLDRKPGRGKIIRCEDTDSDGVADRYTDFVADIDSPRGLCYVGETLYVVHPPFLSSFRDLDDDGVAEQSDVLIKGLGFDLSFRGADHTSNGVRMGIDGWLYLAIGDYGFLNAVAKDGSSMYLHGGGVLRIRPDGTELEPYSLYTRNIYDVAVSPTLDLFTRDNTNDGKGWNTRLHHFIAFADHGYPRLYKNFPKEQLQPLADFGGGSGTGAYFLDEPGIPDDYNNRLYTCDFTTQHVYVHPLERHEATFRVGQDSFYAIKAIDMDVDGSSSIYVCDWVGGGYTYKNPSVGSISRITYPGLKTDPYPNLKAAGRTELVSYLNSDSAVLRINAQQEILKRGPHPEFRQHLIRQVSDAGNHLHARIASLFTFKQLYWVHAQAELLKWVKDDSIREYALRALADRRGESSLVPSEPFILGLKDSDPRVRLQSVIGLGRMGRVEHAAQILPLAVDPSGPLSEDIKERYESNLAIPHIATKTLVHLKAVSASLDALDQPDLQEAALRCLQENHSRSAVDGLIRKLNETRDSHLQVGILKALFRLYHVDKRWDAKKWWTTRPDDRGPYFDPIKWELSSLIHRAIESAFGRVDASLHSELFVFMRKNRLDPEQFDLDVEVDEVQSLIAAANPGSLSIKPLRNAAISSSRALDVQLGAYLALDRIVGDDAFMAQLEVLSFWMQNASARPEFHRARNDFIFSSEHAHRLKTLRQFAARLKGYPKRLVMMITLNLAQSPITTDEEKQLALNLLQKRRMDPELIHAVGELKRLDYREWVVKATASDQHETALAARETLEILDQYRSLLSTSNKTPLDGLDYEEASQILLDQRGDLQLGMQLFARQGCIACHTVTRDQPQKGPFLGDAGSKWKRQDLIQSILQPSAVVAQGFQSQWFETEDDIHEGFVTGVVDGVIELRDSSGRVLHLREADITRQGRREESMMPEGLGANLNAFEFSSLLDYLQSLK